MQNDQWNFDISEMTISSESSSSFNTGSVVVTPPPPPDRIIQQHQQVEATAADLLSDVDNFTELQSLVKSVSVEGGESNNCDEKRDEVEKSEGKDENNELVLLPGGKDSVLILWEEGIKVLSLIFVTLTDGEFKFKQEKMKA